MYKMSIEKQLAAARLVVKRIYRRHGIYLTANDGMCYPQLNPNEDMFCEGESYAQRLRRHIEFCLSETSLNDAEDPTQVVLY